jgi:hypothetical protein
MPYILMKRKEYVWNICNTQIKHICNICSKTQMNTLGIDIYNICVQALQQMQHSNLLLQHPSETIAIYLWNIWNTWNICLQHVFSPFFHATQRFGGGDAAEGKRVRLDMGGAERGREEPRGDGVGVAALHGLWRWEALQWWRGVQGMMFLEGASGWTDVVILSLSNKFYWLICWVVRRTIFEST